MRLFADRLGPKLNLFLLGFVLVLGAAAVLLMTLGFQRTQDEATSSSREGLEEQAQTTLAAAASQYAAFGQSQLEATAGFAQQAARYFVSVSNESSPPAYDLSRLNTNADGVQYDGTPGRRMDIFMPAGTELSDAVRRDLTDSQVLEPLFPTLLEGFSASTRSSDYDAIAIYFQSVNHVTRMYPPVPDITSLPPAPDLQSGLEAAGPEQNPQRATYWSTPYQDVAGRGLVMTALVPVYDGDEYRGVIGVDLSLARLIAQLNAVEPSLTGYAFYVDRTGNLLPTRFSEDIQAEMDDPRNTGFAALIEDMRSGRQAVNRAEIGGEEVFVAYVPLNGIGGYLGLVAPVDEVTQQAAEVESAIDDGSRSTLVFVLTAMAVVLLFGLAAASYLNRRLILRPIGELVDGTRSVASGDLNASIPVRSGDEIGTLAESFNGMTSVLRERTEALRDSEAELSALFRSMTDVVVRVNREGRYMSIAPTSQPDLVGPASQFVGKTVFDAYDREQAEAMLAPVVRALDTGQPQTVEYPTPYPGGVRWFTASISPLSEDEVVIVSRDITDRRQKEEELREREEQYRSTFESTSDGIVITRLEDGQIVDVNPAFCEMHGYSRDEMLTLYPTQFIHPDDHHLFVDYVSTVAAGGEYRCRARDFRKDGSLFHVEVLGTPVSYNGQRHILGVVRDITDTVHAEQVLERRVEERTTELAALLRVSQAVASTLELRRVGRAILEELAAVAAYTGATLVTMEGDELVIVDSWGPFQEEVVQGPTARFPRSAIPDVFWETMENGAPVFIDDVRDDSLLARSYRRVFRPFLDLPSFTSIRAWIAVPLVRQGEIVGMLTASHDEPGFFTEDNARLIVAAANQATVAMENARLFHQTQERTRELSALLDLSRQIATKLTYDELVDTIVTQAGALFGTDAVSLILVEDGIATHLGTSNPDILALGIRRGYKYSLRGWNELWSRVVEGRPVLIPDVRGDTADADLYRQAAGEQLERSVRNVRTWMGIPLTAQDRVIGVFVIAHEEVGAFTQSDLDLATALANQAAVALENARLFEETQERTRELQTLLDVSANVASTIELQPLLRLILDQVSAVVDNERASVVIRDRDAALLRVLAVRERGGTEAALGGEGAIFNIGQGNAIWMQLSSGDPVIIDDVRDDTALAASYREVVQPQIDPELRRVRSWMAVPLVLKDEILGIIGLTSGSTRAFSERDARLTAAIGTQAATAIENARLFEETEQRGRESAALLEISQSLTSTLELSQLVRVILAQLGSVVDYTGSSVVLIRGDELEILSSRVLDPPNTPETRGLRFPLVRTSVTWQELEQLKTIVIDDIWGDDIYAREYRATIGEEALATPSFMKIRSWMGVPLAIKGRLIGTLSMSRNEPGWFTADHARIAAAVGKQAALAIENARLFEEAAERTRELQTLLEVSTNVAATIELEPLLNLILEQMRSVAPYDGATFFIRHGDKMRAEAYYTQPDESMDLTTIGIELDTRGLKLWELISRGAPIIIDDVSVDSEEAQAFREAAGPLLQTRFRRIRSWLGVPLMVGDRPVGMLALSGHTVGVFSEQHARLARAVADQSALAIENARLFAEASRRARETEALLRADAELFRSLSLDDVFQALCDVAVDLLSVDKCMVTTIEDDEGRYEVRASRNLPAASLARMAEIRELRPRKELATMHETIVHIDAREAVPEMREVFEAQGVVSTMDVPIRIAGKILGDFAIAYTERHAPTAAEIRLFQALADRASIAIQNAELYEQSQRAASLEERQRLARELHDSVSQALYGIALGARTARTQLDRDPAKAIEPVEYVLSLAEAGLAEMRALIFELRPESLQTEGLVAAIEKHVASTRSRYSLDVNADLCPEPQVGIEVKEALYRVAQEALHNVVKHAHASKVDVRLCGDNGAIELEVRDDGRGFDPKGSYPGHVGLHSMRERIEKLHGSITIESAPGHGSTVRAAIPTAANGR